MKEGGRAAEFRIGSTLGALGRTAQGLLETALVAGPRCGLLLLQPALPFLCFGGSLGGRRTGSVL